MYLILGISYNLIVFLGGTAVCGRVYTEVPPITTIIVIIVIIINNIIIKTMYHVYIYIQLYHVYIHIACCLLPSAYSELHIYKYIYIYYFYIYI